MFSLGSNNKTKKVRALADFLLIEKSSLLLAVISF